MGVGDAAVIGIDGGWLGTVAVPGELDEGVAGIDFLAQHLAEIAPLGAEDVLLLDLVAEELEDVLDPGAGGAELAGGGGDEDARFHAFPEAGVFLSRINARGEGMSVKGL